MEGDVMLTHRINRFPEVRAFLQPSPMASMIKSLLLVAVLGLLVFVGHANAGSDAGVITFNATPSPDFDGDNWVGFTDFVIVGSVFGSRQGDGSGKYEAKYDLDGDGEIGFDDFVIFAGSFGKEPPSSAIPDANLRAAIPDANLRAAIEAALGKASGAPITQAEMATLDSLTATEKDISDLTGLEYATNLTWLDLTSNNITDISVLEGLTNLTDVTLTANNISNLAPLVANTGLGKGGTVDVADNPLNAASQSTHIPALQARGVSVSYVRSSNGASGGGTGERRPSLIIQSVEVSDNNLTAGQSFTLETTVHNQGADPVSSWLSYYRSTDATIDATDALIHEDGGRSVTNLKTSATQMVSLDWTAPPYAGTYYYGVCAGLFKFRNCSTGVRVTVEGSEGGSPDLIVHSPLVSHNSVMPGGKFSLHVKFENIGTGPAAASTVRYYRSDDATIDATDTQLTVGGMSRLAVGQQAGGGFHWTTPFEAGTYYYAVCVDPTLGETNTDNNCTTGVPITVEAVEAGNPDLIVVAPWILDQRPATGEFRLGAWVRNIGTDPAAASTLRYYRSDDATINATDTQVRTHSLRRIAVEGHAGLLYHNYVTAPTSPGTYYYGACVDPVPGETDTDNNCSEAVPMNVGVPDLAVGLTWASTSVPSAGQSFTLRATVRNQGPAEAGSTTLRYYRSDDATIDAADTPIGSDAVSSLTGFDGLVSGPGSRLASSGTSRKSISVSAPSSPSTYYYGACADGVPGETNTDNNCSSGAYVRVVASGEDPFNIELVILGDFAEEHKALFQQAARHWETIITEGLADVNFSANPHNFFSLQGETIVVDDMVDDLRIFVEGGDLSDRGTIVGLAGPFYVRSGNPTGLPAVGNIVIDPDFIDRLQAREPLWQEERLLRNLMLHETAHALGFGTLWPNRDLIHDHLGDAYFSGELAIQAFNVAGGENYRGNKVPVEFSSETCGAGAHWREGVFQGVHRQFGVEVMEPAMHREHVLSAITIQSLADLGYVVDVSRADSYRLPASISTAVPPTASSKPVASHSDFDLGDLGTIYVGDEQGQIIHTISSD